LASDCLVVRRDLVDFVRGAATECDVARIDAHLNVCATCKGAHLEIEELNSHLQAAGAKQVEATLGGDSPDPAD
jgi:predicted anti-sigma-YlaC factor YlaD